MNTSSFKLSLINPDDIKEDTTPVSTAFDELMKYSDTGYIQEVLCNTDNSQSITYPETINNNIKKLTGNDIFYARKFYKVKDKIGNGEMKYIKDHNTREMCTNAWKAITFSNNWDFVAEDIESFMFSKDERLGVIIKTMEELGYYDHSGCSFAFTMRRMQYLVQKGEEEFKKCFN